MKKVYVIVGCLFIFFFLGFIAWCVGNVFDCEYPYALTLWHVRHAKSADGLLVENVIRADTLKSGQKFHWHTCNYCYSGCDWLLSKKLVFVKLCPAVNGEQYFFAYHGRSNVLVPLSDKTAARFPSLLPTGDDLKSFSELDGGATSYWLGKDEEYKIPENWLRSVVQGQFSHSTNAVPM